jgi:hypothetical protein
LFSFIDDSIYTSNNQSVYQIVPGTIDAPNASPTYAGIGLFYPQSGIVILNAAVLANILGITITTGTGPGTGGPLPDGSWPYNSSSLATNYTYNHMTLFESMNSCVGLDMNVRKSEYVPSQHYFVRVMNRDFNYSNNPTYVWDGTDGIHPQGLIYNSDFITDPKTYITSVGLYDDNNNLVAIAKLSRPAVKSFDQELLIKVRLDF